MLVISRKTLMPLAFAAAVTFVGTRQPVFAQAAQQSAQGPQKNWKDRAEFDLYDSITKETQPAKRLELLNSWKEKYPASESPARSIWTPAFSRCRMTSSCRSKR